jgi:hypothetical protein
MEILLECGPSVGSLVRCNSDKQRTPFPLTVDDPTILGIFMLQRLSIFLFDWIADLYSQKVRWLAGCEPIQNMARKRRFV